LDENMARKRILSIRGTVGSDASCKTMSLKYNQLISRLIKGIRFMSIKYGVLSPDYKTAYLFVKLILTKL
jgi:hypothetical protein